MTELAQERSDVCLLSGDIGNRMFDRYKEVAPTRFLNCGIAEANMMSMAAGMALSGLRPVVYTITPFTTTRCLEQIRTGVAYHEAPVVIVGTGSGLSYAELGATHHSLEDLAILRSIPNLQVCAPADSLELEAQLRQAIAEGKPTYIRIGKKGEPDLLSGACISGDRQSQSPKKRQKNSSARHWPNSFRSLASQHHSGEARHPAGHRQHGQHQAIGSLLPAAVCS